MKPDDDVIHIGSAWDGNIEVPYLDNGCEHGETSTELEAEYRTDEYGIPVILRNAVTRMECSQCRTVLGHLTPPLEETLFHSIAAARLLMPNKLAGDEIRHLRKLVRVSVPQLAREMGITPEAIYAWEKKKATIKESSEKLLRLVMASYLTDVVWFRPQISSLARMKIDPVHKPSTPLVFSLQEYFSDHDDEERMAYRPKKEATAR